MDQDGVRLNSCFFFRSTNCIYFSVKKCFKILNLERKTDKILKKCQFVLSRYLMMSALNLIWATIRVRSMQLDNGLLSPTKKHQ